MTIVAHVLAAISLIAIVVFCWCVWPPLALAAVAIETGGFTVWLRTRGKR